MSTDKLVAELMAWHRAAVQAAVELDAADSFGSSATKERLDEMRAWAAALTAELEQEIRRALDWGEPVAFVNGDELDRLVAKGSAVLPSDRTWIEAVAVKDGWRTTPLYARRKDQ